MKKFEYKILTLLSHESNTWEEKQLNELGEKGWELVNSIKLNESNTKFFFKKELDTKWGFR